MRTEGFRCGRIYLEEKLEVKVAEDGGGGSPWPNISRVFSMAPAEGVGSAKHHNLLVVEAHAAKDLPDGGGRLGVGSRVSLERAERE